MSISQKQSEQEQTEKPQVKEIKLTPEEQREVRLNQYKQNAQVFNEDTKKTIEIQPNVPITLLFPANFYLDWDELYNEALSVKKLKPEEASQYAEQNYMVKRTLEESAENKGEQFSRTTWKVTDPNSTYPTMVRELRITSYKAIEAINTALIEEAKKMKEDKPIVVTILKKTGSNKFKVEWEITARAA